MSCLSTIVYFLTLPVSQLIANYLEIAVNEHGCVLNLVVYVRNATTFYLTLVEGKLDKNKVKRKNDQDFELVFRIKQASRRWYKHQGVSTHWRHTGSHHSWNCLSFPRSIFRCIRVRYIFNTKYKKEKISY